jgi:hypothetical protein
MNHTQRKYYIVLAVKKDNLVDIRGLCEGSFSMDWQCGRVNLWIADDGRDYAGKPVRKHFHKFVKQLEKRASMFTGSHKKLQQLKGKRTMLRKQMANARNDNFAPCGRSRAEYIWNWVKHYSMSCGKHLREQGYEIRPYRVGSKFCPVEIDFTERIAIEKKQLKWDKFKWRNPPYRIKQTTI